MNASRPWRLFPSLLTGRQEGANGKTACALYLSWVSCGHLGVKKALIYAALRARKWRDKGFIFNPSKTAFYRVTKRIYRISRYTRFQLLQPVCQPLNCSLSLFILSASCPLFRFFLYKYFLYNVLFILIDFLRKKGKIGQKHGKPLCRSGSLVSTFSPPCPRLCAASGGSGG